MTRAADLRPMMAVSWTEPFDDPDWVFEPKWDGVRVLAHIGDGAVRLVSRNGNDVTAAYPELGVLAGTIDAGSVVDGEVVAFDDGRPSFERLQSRMHVREAGRVRTLAATTPVVLMAFDLLVDGGESLIELPLSDRRRRLEERITVSDAVQLSPQVAGDGIAMYAAAEDQRLEGIVAKRAASTYRPGRRSPDWRKIKRVHEVDAVIVGWRPGTGGRADGLGSIVLGLYEGTELRSVGSAGSGFDARSLSAMEDLLEMVETDTPPLDPETVPDAGDVHWVSPELVAVVEYRQVTSAGHLRAPVFKGMRSDKPAGECTTEQLVR